MRQAYEAFVRAATDLAEAGMVFEMVHRSGPEGGMAPREPRGLSVAAVPEQGIEKDCHTVVLMGVGFWEFLPGFFYGSERVIEGRRIAMDVGSFRFVESSPSGDAEIIGQAETGPLAQYMRIDISGDGLVKSLAISNAALGGAFVAAYRAYLEVLAGCPYKMLHPYRQLGASVAPAADPATQPQSPQQPQRPAPPRPAAPLSARQSAPERGRHPGLVWGWLAVPPALAAAYLLGVLATGPDTPAPARAPQPPPLQAPPAAQPRLEQAPGPAAPMPVPPVGVTAPPPQNGGTELPLPPPPAPPPPPIAAAPPPVPAPAQPGSPPSAPPAAAEAPSATPAPPSGGQLGGMWRPGLVTQDSNVRAAPFGGAPILRVVPGGTQVRIIENSEGWLRVALPDGTTLGWIYGGLIQ
ncbi:SH3 domain-containing protein [Roseomonas sp. M0104]|uniref:SH3 domain-containing protein n=1 Tax=Teichococcus coralli TaxID=2545983 RepID=A0A845B9M3_9PROT|nr:SH3 domain-containing protein [Pseudoroseomonas coralli]MXP62082.1 SH3 domain-containing protein [Pseudoroseomonas coralli]